jgi:hypothetical protein
LYYFSCTIDTNIAYANPKTKVYTTHLQMGKIMVDKFWLKHSILSSVILLTITSYNSTQ